MFKGTDYLLIELAFYAALAVYAIYRHRLLVREVTATADANATANAATANAATANANASRPPPES